MSVQLTLAARAARVPRVALLIVGTWLVAALAPPDAQAILAPPKPMVWADGSDTKPLEDDYLDVPSSDPAPTRRDAISEPVSGQISTTRGVTLMYVMILRTLFNFLPR